MAGRMKIPDEINALTKSQLLNVIDESALTEEDRVIAQRVLLDHWAQIDIAAEIGYDRSVVSRRSKHIFERLAYIATLLYK